MAAYCTKCGAPLASSTGFCSACGTPAGAGAVTPQPRYPPAAAGYPATGYPPPAKSGGAVKTILIVIAVVVGLGVIAISVGVWRISRGVHVTTNSNGSTTVSVPGRGTISAGADVVTDSALGVPVYPGAVRQKGGLNMNSGTASMAIAHFTTSDSPSQVADFYKSKMGEGTVAVATGSNDGTVLNSGGSDTDRIMVTVGKGSAGDAGKTTIVIMHTKKN